MSTMIDTVVERNEVGVQIGDASSPSLRSDRITGNRVGGITIDGSAAPKVSETAVEENGEIGVQATARQHPC